MVILGTQSFEQSNRLWKGLGTLNRPVRHVHRRLATAAYSSNITTVFNKIEDQFVVTPRRRMVNGVITVNITDIDLRTEFLD